MNSIKYIDILQTLCYNNSIYENMDGYHKSMTYYKRANTFFIYEREFDTKEVHEFIATYICKIINMRCGYCDNRVL